MKIYFFDVESWEKDYLTDKLQDLSPVLVHEPLTLENVSDYQDLEIVSTFLASKLAKDLLDKLPNLKLIATRSTGFDHIDLSAAQARGVAICNVPFYGENTVAEQAFALLLALSRKICQSYDRTQHLKFNHDDLTGFDLKGKTLGLVGVGHIGQYAVKMGNGFAMRVIASDPNQDVKLAEKLNFEYVSLEELLKQADVISLHAPYNKHTHHLINRENVKLIKPGAVLINTARGGLLETEALIWALDNGILAGAGLDVLEGEPELNEEWEVITKDFATADLKMIVMNNTLIERDNVIVTPHNAFNTREAINRILDTTQQNIRAFIKGEPKNLVGVKK
jgi:D-lactate dehydrogenase